MRITLQFWQNKVLIYLAKYIHDNHFKYKDKMQFIQTQIRKHQPVSVPAVANSGLVPAQPFIICKFSAGIVKNVT